MNKEAINFKESKRCVLEDLRGGKRQGKYVIILKSQKNHKKLNVGIPEYSHLNSICQWCIY